MYKWPFTTFNLHKAQQKGFNLQFYYFLSFLNMETDVSFDTYLISEKSPVKEKKLIRNNCKFEHTLCHCKRKGTIERNGNETPVRQQARTEPFLLW